MMIKEVAEEIGVHPSTVSRAVANKIRAHAAGSYRTPLLLFRRRERTRGCRYSARRPQAQSQKAHRRGKSTPSLYRRPACGLAARAGNSGHAPYRRQVSRRSAHTLHPPAPPSRGITNSDTSCSPLMLLPRRTVFLQMLPGAIPPTSYIQSCQNHSLFSRLASITVAN